MCITIKKLVQNENHYSLYYTLQGEDVYKSIDIEINDGKLTIPDTIEGKEVKYIERCAFDDCMNLEFITLPCSLSRIGEYAFNECSNLKEIVIPDSVESIGSHAFSGCLKLKNVTLPDNDQFNTIEPYTFENCIYLQNIKFTKTSQLLLIDDYAFSKCLKLEKIVIPAGVSKIKPTAFYGCASLTKIEISDKSYDVSFNVL